MIEASPLLAATAGRRARKIRVNMARQRDVTAMIRRGFIEGFQFRNRQLERETKASATPTTAAPPRPTKPTQKRKRRATAK